MSAQTSSNGNSIIALTEQSPEAGAVVWWRLSGSVDLQKLARAWGDEGLDARLLPEPPTPRVALHRAVGDAAAAQHLDERRVEVHVGADAHVGYALVARAADVSTSAVSYELRATVSMNAVGRPTVERGSLCTETAYAEIVRGVNDAYDRHLESVNQTDVSGWLAGLMGKVDAVALRDTGGVYFVPRHALEAWRRMSAVIRASSAHALLGVPAMRSEEAVASVLDVLAQEAGAEVARVQEELLSEKLGERALRTRDVRAEALEQKLARYEALLGESLEGLRAKVEVLRAGLAAQILVALADSEVPS